MTRELTGWETTRLSKHFILLDFLADHAVYRCRKALPFEKIWNDEHDMLARGLCNALLEPLMEEHGPISVADAFWPSVFKVGHSSGFGPKHRWNNGEATVDITLYDLVDKFFDRMDKTQIPKELEKAIRNFSKIDGCRDRIIRYINTEFLCITYKPVGATKNGTPNSNKKKGEKLRAHHVRVGRYFNILDFCHSGWAVERGIDPVPPKLDKGTRCYRPIPEEGATRSFAAALDPLVAELGRVSVVRGMETDEFPRDEHAELHRWDEPGPWRLVCVLPQGADPERARDIVKKRSHVRCAQTSPHASGSHALALVVEPTDYDDYRGLRPIYRNEDRPDR